MPISQQRRRQLWYGISFVRNTIRLAHVRARNIIREALQPDFRRAVGVQIDCCALRAQNACGKTGQRAAERVAGGYDFEGGVLGLCFLDGGENVGLCLEPGLPETDAG